MCLLIAALPIASAATGFLLPFIRSNFVDDSNKTLTGDETSIVGLGNQEWKVGTGLCDSAFANATKS